MSNELKWSRAYFDSLRPQAFACEGRDTTVCPRASDLAIGGLQRLDDFRGTQRAERHEDCQVGALFNADGLLDRKFLDDRGAFPS
jgi:hypothetical protein